jgi:hypothetical protein
MQADPAALTPMRASAHAPPMGELVDLPDARSRWFADERGRSLRATWHPEAGVVVLSLWQADRCIGTFRVSGADAAELGELLAGVSAAGASVDGIAAEPG